MQAQARQVADRIRQCISQGVGREHEYRVLPAGAVGLRDRRFYGDLQGAFAAEGFSHLGDLEDVTVRSQGLRAVLRVLTDREGGITAAFYRARLPLPQRLLARLFLGFWTIDAVDLETSFDDGNHLITTTCAQAGGLNTPPRIARETVDPATSVPDLLRHHRQRLEAYGRTHPEARRVPRRSMEDQMNAQREMDRLKASHSAERGHSIDWNEFMALGGSKLEPELRRAVWQELRRGAGGDLAGGG